MVMLPNSSDDDLKALAGLNRIFSLTIQSSRVTDKGLKHLHNRKYLGILELFDTKATPQGVKRFQAAVPGCTVTCRRVTPTLKPPVHYPGKSVTRVRAFP